MTQPGAEKTIPVPTARHPSPEEATAWLDKKNAVGKRHRTKSTTLLRGVTLL
jgi:hypothetical protein